MYETAPSALSRSPPEAPLPRGSKAQLSQPACPAAAWRRLSEICAAESLLRQSAGEMARASVQRSWLCRSGEAIHRPPLYATGHAQGACARVRPAASGRRNCV